MPYGCGGSSERDPRYCGGFRISEVHHAVEDSGPSYSCKVREYEVASIGQSSSRKHSQKIRTCSSRRSHRFGSEGQEFVVLLGPSGCGKTSLLNITTGLELQDEGNVFVDDELVNQFPPEDRDMAMVFQSYALYPHLNAFNNIAFPLRFRKVPKTEIPSKVNEAAKMLGIIDVLDRKPYQMSGGERQRVALARAIVREPKVFLLDEPLSNLDAKIRVSTRAELKKLHERLAATFIYVTHDQIEAFILADE